MKENEILEQIGWIHGQRLIRIGYQQYLLSPKKALAVFEAMQDAIAVTDQSYHEPPCYVLTEDIREGKIQLENVKEGSRLMQKIDLEATAKMNAETQKKIKALGLKSSPLRLEYGAKKIL
jgi:hypothetical protein